MNRYNYILAILLCYTSSLHGRELRRTFETSRYQGHGNAGLANVSGISSLYYNPAGLALHPERSEEISILDPQITASEELFAAYNKQEEYRDVELDGAEIVGEIEDKNLHVGFQDFLGGSFDQLTFGFIAGNYTNLSIKFLDANLEKSQALLESVSHTGIMVGHGREIMDDLYAGVVLKGLMKKDIYYPGNGFDLLLDISEISKAEKGEKKEIIREKMMDGEGKAVGLDFGLIYKKEGRHMDAAYGLVVQDVGDTSYGNVARPDKQMVSAGSTLSTEVERQNFAVAFDYLDLFNHSNETFSKHTLFGLMWDYQRFVGASMGLHQGYPTAGLWCALWLITAEYSFYIADVGEQTGMFPSYRNSIHARIGWQF